MPDDPRLRIFPDEFVPNVQASDGYKRWAKSSPGDLARWVAFRDALLASGTGAVPVMSTKLGKALVAAGEEHMSITHLVGQVTNPYPPAPVSPVSPPSPYTNVDFSTGEYHTGTGYYGNGVGAVFEAYQSDPRLATWGGQDAINYDSLGMTLDTTQRVHLRNYTPGVNNSPYASWQELRTTDGPWAESAPTLAKSSLNIPTAATLGPDGWAWGIERWFAFDILFPLNIDGVSFEFPTTWHTLGDLHSNGGNADPALTQVYPYWTHPRHYTFLVSPDTTSVPYYTVDLLPLTDSGGSRVTSSFNVWHEVVIGMKTAYDGSPGNSSGWVAVWFNGVQALAPYSTPQFAVSETGPYFQLQNYTQYPTSYLSGATRSAVVYGGFRAGLTRADVQRR